VLLHLMSLTAIAEVLGFSHQALLPSLPETCSGSARKASA